ncbi:MAG: glycosyltransferase, partial [Rhodomicrobium sp.]|nr:glycosyltransferase [Rhodomicrobium sp.]
MSSISRPDVSVIIPVHNRTAYLGDSIASVLDQAWDGSLEIICVDDGSTTDPFQGLRDRLPAHVRLLRKEHEGVGAARQHAFEQARGRYIAFNDDDDLWLPDKLADQVAILERFAELDMLFSDLEVFTENGPVPGTFNRNSPTFETLGPPRPVTPDLPSLGRFEPNALLPMTLACKVPLFLQTVLVRRDFMARIGGMEPRARSCGDCLDFCVRASHHGTIGYLDRPTFRLRRGHDHMTAALDWFRRELAEFFLIFPSYPPSLQAALGPWIGPPLIDKAWLHFCNREFREAPAIAMPRAIIGS